MVFVIHIKIEAVVTWEVDPTDGIFIYISSLGFRCDPTHGPVLFWESSVHTEVVGFQLQPPLNPDSALSPQRFQTCQKPPHLWM